MPRFVRYEEFAGRSFEVNCGDNDLNVRPRERLIAPGEPEQGPPDRMMGYGSLEFRLSRLLEG